MVLMKIDEFLDTETPGKQFGSSDVCYAAKTNWENLGKGPPGSRSKDNARTANTGNWENFAQRERGKGRKGKERNANMENEERIIGDNEVDPERSEIDPELGEEFWGRKFYCQWRRTFK